MAKHKQQNEKNNGKMKRKLYEKELHKLQVQLCHLQEWVKAKGLKIIIVFESNYGIRTIYTDGRPLPPQGRPQPYWHGYSVGRWDGDTLVVETVGFSPLTEITRFVPFSAKARIVERFRLSDPDTMSIETTITDPEILAAPNVSTRSLRRHRNWTTAEYICEENNRNFVDSAGKAGIDLTVPGAKK